MFESSTLKRLFPFTAWLVFFSLVPFVFAQETRERRAEGERVGINEKNSGVIGDAVLWREPSDIASRDLFLGPGGDDKKPNLSNVTFLAENPGGYSVKYQARDGSGRKWVVKLGNEARPETTALRLLWAV